MLWLTLGDLSSTMVQDTGVFFRSVNLDNYNQLKSEIGISWFDLDLRLDKLGSVLLLSPFILDLVSVIIVNQFNSESGIMEICLSLSLSLSALSLSSYPLSFSLFLFVLSLSLSALSLSLCPLCLSLSKARESL